MAEKIHFVKLGLQRVIVAKKILKGLAMGAAPKAFRNEVEEWSESGTADVAARTQ